MVHVRHPGVGRFAGDHKRLIGRRRRQRFVSRDNMAARKFIVQHIMYSIIWYTLRAGYRFCTYCYYRVMQVFRGIHAA